MSYLHSTSVFVEAVAISATIIPAGISFTFSSIYFFQNFRTFFGVNTMFTQPMSLSPHVSQPSHLIHIAQCLWSTCRFCAPVRLQTLRYNSSILIHQYIFQLHNCTNKSENVAYMMVLLLSASFCNRIPTLQMLNSLTSSSLTFMFAPFNPPSPPNFLSILILSLSDLQVCFRCNYWTGSSWVVQRIRRH